MIAGLDGEQAKTLVEWAQGHLAETSAEELPAADAVEEEPESPKMNEDEFMAALSKALKESEGQRDSVQEAAAALPGGDNDETKD